MVRAGKWAWASGRASLERGQGSLRVSALAPPLLSWVLGLLWQEQAGRGPDSLFPVVRPVPVTLGTWQGQLQWATQIECIGRGTGHKTGLALGAKTSTSKARAGQPAHSHFLSLVMVIPMTVMAVTAPLGGIPEKLGRVLVGSGGTPSSRPELMKQLGLAATRETRCPTPAHPKQTPPSPLANPPARCPGNSQPQSLCWLYCQGLPLRALLITNHRQIWQRRTRHPPYPTYQL